ncbi:MAG: MnhB domain-containing protein [Candidatus Woesearchaeota archaeon]
MITKIIKTIAKLTFVFAIVFGIYVIVNGHLTPGGGFQGGAILATAFALLMIPFGFDSVRDHKSKFSALESIGLLMFIALAFLGMKIAFFDNFLADPVAYGPNPGALFSAGVIPLMNIAVGIEVLGALTLILILMSKASEDNLENTKRHSIVDDPKEEGR